MSKQRIIIILILLVWMCSCSSQFSRQVVDVPKYSDSMNTGSTNRELSNEERPLKPYIEEKILFEKPIERKLASGITILYLKNPELPKIYGSLYFKGGALWDKDNELSTTTTMGSMLRGGGTQRMSPEELDLFLEKKAAGITTSFGGESGGGSFDCLKSDIEDVFQVFSEVILTPRFDEARFKLTKFKTLENIKRRKDDPNNIADISFIQSLYRGTPTGRISTSDDIKKITINDIKSSYHRYIKPQNAYLVVSGDIELEQIEKLAERYFTKEAFKLSNPYIDSEDPYFNRIKEYPEFNFNQRKGILFIEGDYEQATIVAGQLSFPRMAPEEYLMPVYNGIFGIGLASDISLRIRTQLGLAYSAQGSVSTGLGRGQSYFSLQTKAETTGVALIESLNVIDNSKAKLPTADRVEEQKNGILNSYVFANESPWSVLNRFLGYRITNYPDDYNEKMIERIKTVTPQDVVKLAKMSWKDSDWLIVVVGSKKAYNSILSVKNKFPTYLKNVKIMRGTFGEKLDLIK